MTEIAIIGAGMAGLAAASDLQAAGHRVTIYEKSRGVGGRATTRRIDNFKIDHGAQYVKATSGRARALVEAVAGAHDIGLPIWLLSGAGHVREGDRELNDEPKWTWPEGVNRLAKALAHDLTVRSEVTVAAIEGAPGAWQLHDDAGALVGSAEIVVLTPPGAQSAALVQSIADGRLRDPLLAELAKVRYRPCLSLAFAYDGPSAQPWYALINSDRQHPIAWLAREEAKPGHVPAGASLLLAQMAPAWSETHWEALSRGSYGQLGADLPAPAAEVEAALEAILGGLPGARLWCNAQRWRYALPDASADLGQINALGAPYGLYFAGDFLAPQGRVHLALECGWAVAAMIRQS